MASYTFIATVANDLELLLINLPYLCLCYPDSRIVVITDGDDNHGYEALAAGLSVELLRGDRIYVPRMGGQVLQRILDAFLLVGHADYLVKFDADTRWARPFRENPPAGDAIGCIWGAYGVRYLQGGCRIFSRSLVNRLDEERIFIGPRYKEIRTWAPPAAWSYYEGRHQLSEDLIVRHALLEMGVPLTDWREIFSVGHVKHWRGMDPHTLRAVQNEDQRFAVTHPWKLEDAKAWDGRSALTRKPAPDGPRPQSHDRLSGGWRQ